LSLLSEYRAARDGAVLADRSDLGRLSFEGRDAADLLHRLSTNAVKDLRDGEGVATVFTTPKGRILDLVVVQRLGTRLRMETGAGRAAAVRQWIDRYTFREEIRVEDRSAADTTLGLYGAGAERVAAALCGETAATRPPHHPVAVRVGDVEAMLARSFPLAGGGYHFTLPAGSGAALQERLLAAGAREAGADCLDLLRIEAGLGSPDHELTEDYNPWEACLQDAISLDKGCYVGQEVIARLNTYQKVSRLLARLRIDGTEVPVPGAPLRIGAEAAGTLTSAAGVPGEARVAALGYLRAGDVAGGQEVRVGGAERELPGRVEGAARRP
jgi:tRNA-modifying protein YgfZ